MSTKPLIAETPWTIEDDGSEILTVRGADGQWVAGCSDGHYNDDGDWIRAGECEANARLIAAAPELLAVAQLLSILTEENDDRLFGAYVKDGVIRAKGSTLDLIEKARAAIRKATGDTQ